MREISVVNTLEGEDVARIAAYRTHNGLLVHSNVALAAHSPYDGTLMTRVRASKEITASAHEVEDKFVVLCSCKECGETINVDPTTGKQIIASGELKAHIFCVTCGTENAVEVPQHDREGHDDDDHDDDDDDDHDPHEASEHEDEDEDEEDPEEAYLRRQHENRHSDDDDDDDDHHDHHEDDDDDGDDGDEGEEDGDDGEEDEDDEDASGNSTGVEASFHDDDEEEPEEDNSPAAVTASVVSTQSTVLSVSGCEALASSGSVPNLVVAHVTPDVVAVYNVEASGSLLPVLQLDKAKASPAIQGVFNDNQLLCAAVHQIVASNGGKVEVPAFASLGARDISYSVPVTSAVQRRIEAGINAVTASVADEKSHLIDDVRQCMAIASVEMVKGVRSDMPNPLREELLAGLSRTGVQDATSIVDEALETAGSPVMAAIIDRTLDLLAKPLASRNEVSQMVEAANFRSASVPTASAASESLSRGSIPFPALASAYEPKIAPQPQRNEGSGRFSSLFQNLEIQKLGR